MDSKQKKGAHAGGDGYLRSKVLKRSIAVGRHRTSISLEDVFWSELRSIAKQMELQISELIARIDADRKHSNLSSAIRVFVFEHRRRPIREDAASKSESAVT
jgi:predicted DNA-binding ribbon-helix-helix protein